MNQGRKLKIVAHQENPDKNAIEQARDSIRKVIRLRLENGRMVVGTIIPDTCVSVGDVYRFRLRGKEFDVDSHGDWPVTYCPRNKGAGSLQLV